MLQHSEIDIEFAICWVNHDWTRSWTNRAGALDTLIAQEYNIGNECNDHASYLAKIFADKRYIKINDKPKLQIYEINEYNKFYILELKKILKEKFNTEIIILQTLKNKNEIKINIADLVIFFQPSYNLIQKNTILSILIKSISKLPFF